MVQGEPKSPARGKRRSLLAKTSNEPVWAVKAQFKVEWELHVSFFLHVILRSHLEMVFLHFRSSYMLPLPLHLFRLGVPISAFCTAIDFPRRILVLLPQRWMNQVELYHRPLHVGYSKDLLRVPLISVPSQHVAFEPCSSCQVGLFREGVFRGCFSGEAFWEDFSGGAFRGMFFRKGVFRGDFWGGVFRVGTVGLCSP